MRSTLVLALAASLALAGCGKKKSPQSPSAAPPDGAAAPASDEEKNVNTPDDADDAKPMSADPEEGGE